MRHFLIILFLTTSTTVVGQLSIREHKAIDSLKKCINDAKHDTIRISAYNSWDNIIYITDPALDLEINQKIIDIAEKNLKQKTLTKAEQLAFKKSLALALNSLGIIFYNKGENIKSLNYYSKSLKIREEIQDKKGIAATLNNFGIIYQDQGESSKAIKYYTQSLKINEAIGDKKGEANCLSNIGRIYLEQKDPQKALEYQRLSLKIREQLGDKHGMAIVYNNIGAIYSELGNIDKTIEYFNKCLELSKIIGDTNKIALALGNMGQAYSKKDKNTEALEYLNQSLKIFEKTGDEKRIAACLNSIGNLYKKKGEHEIAINFAKKALRVAQDIGLVTVIRDASQSLAQHYKNTGKYREAIEMYELYMQMHDSILNENNQKVILEQELKYNYDKQKALDEKEYEKELAVSTEREQKQKVITYSVTGGLMLVVLFSLFIYNRLSYTKKQKKTIETQKDLVEKKQKEILSSITYAKRLQEAMLPTEEYIKTLLPESFIFYKPKDIVAGDFYWIEQKDGLIYVAVADCTGHGIPGAIISVICSNALNRAVIEFNLTDPGKILDKTRELVLDTFSRSDKDVKDGMDISLLCINKRQNSLKWSGANTPLWYVSNDNLIEIKADKQPIGKADKSSPFKSYSIPLLKGDIFYLFSDGYADQFGGPNGKKFKSKMLKKLLLKSSTLSCNEQNHQIESAFNDWIGTQDQIDDICLIGIKI